MREEEEEEEEEEKRRKKRRKSKVWNLYGNYDLSMDYWTFGLLYGIV